MGTSVTVSVAQGLSDNQIKRMASVGRVVIRQMPHGATDTRPAFTDRAGVPVTVINEGQRALGRAIVTTTYNTGGLKSFEFPYGPKQITYQGSSLEYQEVQRPGLQPLLKSIAPKNRSVTLSSVIGDRESGGCESVEDQLDILHAMAREDLDCLFIHGGQHLGFFVRIVELTVTSRERTLQGAITRAVVDITMNESRSLNVNVIGLTAITREPEVENENEDDEPPKTAEDTQLIVNNQSTIVDGVSAWHPVMGVAALVPAELDTG
jgi:phage protein U